MSQLKSNAWRLVTALIAVLFAQGPVLAQDAANYPSRPIRMVVPFAPGSTTDTTARVVGLRLGEAWKQSVVVDNKAGASGVIGLDYVAKAQPDGHTLGLLIVGHLTLAKTPFDLVKDFSPVSQLTSNTYVMVISTQLPAKTTKELVALAKSKPGALKYGSSGQGGVIHLAAELFTSLADIKMSHVPYKGNAPAMTDLAAGRIDMLIAGLPTVAPFVKSGRARVMGVTSPKRLDSARDLPTLQEGGVPGYEVEGWYGVVGPAGMPAPIVDKLAREIANILKMPETIKKFEAGGITAVSSTPAQFAAYIRSEREKWRKVAAGLRMK